MSAAGRIVTLCLGLLIPAGAIAQSATPAPQVQLTLPQARALAIETLKRGDAQIAAELAKGLLQADPKSTFAYLVLARARGMQGDVGAARRAAGKAYRTAETRELRFSSAQLAARLSYREGRPTLAQLWLRRAVQAAPDATAEQQIGQDYARLRNENPLRFSLRFSLRPSNNVNNGSDRAVQIIDGLPFTGSLSGSAQALSGTIGAVDAQLSYRLRGSAESTTTLGSRLYIQRVALSDDARAQAPEVSGSDFGSTYVEANLTHSFAVKKTDNAHLQLALGTYWSADAHNYDFVRAGAGRRWALGTDVVLSLNGTLEHRASAFESRFDSTSLSLQGAVTRKLASDDRVSLSFNLRKTRSDFGNNNVRSATLGVNYAFARPLGPAQVSAGLVAGYSDYPDYSIVFEVPGGRQDRSIHADLNFFFADYDYAGFAPNLRLRAGRTSSNVSRFETEELSLSLGIQSKF